MTIQGPQGIYHQSQALQSGRAPRVDRSKRGRGLLRIGMACLVLVVAPCRLARRGLMSCAAFRISGDCSICLLLAAVHCFDEALVSRPCPITGHNDVQSPATVTSNGESRTPCSRMHSWAPVSPRSRPPRILAFICFAPSRPAGQQHS